MSTIRTLILLAVIVLILLAAAVPQSEPGNQRFASRSTRLHGQSATTVKAERDTLYLLGGPGRDDGSFETDFGAPHWHGWTHEDITHATSEPRWHVSDLQPVEGSLSMWCGEWFDDDPGYGNDWRQNLRFVWPLPDATGPVTVHWTGQLVVDVEPVYDSVRLQAWQAGDWQTLVWYDGPQAVAIDQTVVLDPAAWEGPEGPAVALRIRVESDNMYSDEDGLYDSDGAARADLLAVSIDGAPVDFEDFEDGVSDHWQPTVDPGAGDFTRIWSGLGEIDVCASNYTQQVAFIDDGVVVPGTGGSWCITWCYGPEGYVVNSTGGLSPDPQERLVNVVVSPPIAVPAGHEGIDVAVSTYLHEDFNAPNSAGIFFFWEVRGTDVDDPAALESAEWRGDNTFYYGEGVYRRLELEASPYLPPGSRWIQVRLGVNDIWHMWHPNGHDATPAPYIDDVAVRSWPLGGPAISTDRSWLAQDTFPAAGAIDATDPAAASCRFDMARNLAPGGSTAIIPGDSLVFDVVPVRAGSVLEGPPVMHVVLKPNPIFAAVRVLPPGFAWDGALLRGAVDGAPVHAPGGGLVEDRYSFDLPDTGFFYPGDEIRYFVEARDRIGGEVGMSRLPADTTGITEFVSAQIVESTYPDLFSVRALPGVDALGDEPADYFHPRVLLWFDHDDAGDLIKWQEALRDCHYDDDEETGIYFLEYDIYRTRVPGQGEGNGLGGRATAALLDGYDFILYDCGALGSHTISVGAAGGDPSPDAQLLDAWLEGFERSLFLTGDDLAADLDRGGTVGQDFLATHLSAQFFAGDVRPFIQNQYAPLIRRAPASWYPQAVTHWISYGGCQPIRDFDAVLPAGTAEVAAEFADVFGDIGVFPYAAALLNHDPGLNNLVFFSPVSFGRIFNSPEWVPPAGYPLGARAALLYEWLPRPFVGVGDDELPRALTVSAYPNPFNPRVTIALDLPRAGAATVKIHDVRGALVRTLHAERLAAGRHELSWSGDDERGAAVASGVYFYRVEAGGQARRGKLTLVR